MIPRATRSTFVATPSSVGHSIAVQVIASRRGYADVVRTLSYRSVAPGELPAVGRPSLVGTPRLGKVAAGEDAAGAEGCQGDDPVGARQGRSRRPQRLHRLSPRRRDLGSRLVARVRVGRFGYRTQSVASGPTGVVRTTPTMRVVTARGAHGSPPT